MKLAHFFIDHPRYATVINIFIVIFGLAAMTRLPIAQYPNIVPTTVQITTAFPGASADTIARTVATPLEQSINGVEGMDYILSQSTGDGHLIITVIFKVGTDANAALMLTRNRVQDVLTRLPQEVQLQGVQVKKTIQALLLGVFPVSPKGTRSREYMANYMLKVRDEIARIPGVADFWILGDRQYSMRIWIDPDKTAAYKINPQEIMSALRSQNAQVSGGLLNQPPVGSAAAYQINIEALGRLTTPDQFADIIVKTDDKGRSTRIRDIGRVELGSIDYGSAGFADKYESAPWWVIATPDANVVEVEQAVWAKIDELKKTWPSDIETINMYDPTTFVTKSINEVIETIFIAILLVVGVVYLFLQNWRATLIPVVAIPVSLIGSFTLLSMLGISINNLSLFGLVLAVGIVVDDAIVVVENVERNMSLGQSAKEAAHNTMNEVSGALIAIALTLCAVFVPSVFIFGIPGLFFKQFAITIASSTLISCFVSLTLSPALCAVLLKPHKIGDKAMHVRGVQRLMQPIFGRFNRGFNWLSSSYGHMTAKLVRAVGGILIAYLVLVTITGLQMSRMSSAFIPEQDIGYLATVVMLPPGTSLAHTTEVAEKVRDIALSVPGAKHSSANPGFDVTTNTVASNVATVFTSLPSLYGEHPPGGDAASMLKKTKAAMAGFKDAFVIVVNPPAVQGLGAAGGFKMMVEDRNNLGPQALAKATNDLVAAANKDPAFAGVFTLFNSGAPSVFADIDRQKAEKLGLSPADVFSAMQLYIGAQYVNDFNYLGRTFPVFAQGDAQFRNTKEDIGRLRVRNTSGEMVPIGSVMTFKDQTAPYRIPRYNLFPAAEVMGAAKPGVASGTAMAHMEQLAKDTLPQGMSFEWTELSHQEAQHGTPTLFIFGASALFVFLVLAAQYESWRTPLAIVLIVPMCLLAASTGLNVRGMPIDILAQIGFIVLVGLAAKNAILIVEFAKHHEDHEGLSPEDAATHSAKERLRPILMTSFAFILGVLPLAIARGAGAEMRQSLGTTVFFGMLGVTAFGLLFTPALYALVQNLSKRK